MIAGAAAPAPAQIVKTPNGYLLRVKYVPGQVVRFETSSSIANKGTSEPSSVLKMPITLSVLNVKGGKAYLNLSMGAGVLDGNKVSDPTEVKMSLDDRNQADKGPGVPGIGAFPDRPMQAGSTWHSGVPIRALGTLLKVDGVFRFQGMKPTQNGPLAVISYSLSGGATGTGIMMLMPKDGSIYSNETNLSVSAPDAAIYLIHMVWKRRM